MIIMKELESAMLEAITYISKAAQLSGPDTQKLEIGDKILIDYRTEGRVPDEFKRAEERVWEKTGREQDKNPGVYLGTVSIVGDLSIAVNHLRKLDASPEYRIGAAQALYISPGTGRTGSGAQAYLVKD
jgi:hypothetical protein